MSQLSRVLQKIFGSSGATNQFGRIGSDNIGSPFTTKDLTDIQSLGAYLSGLYALTNSATEPPRIQDLNSLYLLFSSQLAYLFQAGIPEWEAGTEYYNNVSICQVVGAVYISTYGSAGTPNLNFNPTSNPTKWTLLTGVPPINSNYTQYPGESAPSTLWPNTTWVQLFNTEGVFFRTEGGNASAWNSGIQTFMHDAHTHIQDTHTHTDTGHYHGPGGAAVQFITNTGGPGIISGGPAFGVQAWTANGIAQISSTTATNQNNGGVENRPVNRTYRIWRRSA